MFFKNRNRNPNPNPKVKEENGIFKSLVAAYFILAFHVILIASIGCLVLFFRGIVQYMFWIFIGCTSLVIYSGYRIIKRMREEKKSLREMLNSPMFQGRNVEISFLGGFASFKIGNSSVNSIGWDPVASVPQLEDPASARIRKLKELSGLLEKKLITLDEFERMKEELLSATSKHEIQHTIIV